MQTVGQRNNRRDDFLIGAVRRKLVDKAPVYLEGIDREAVKVAERRMPCAEVIDMEMNPHVPQLIHHLHGSIDVFHNHTFRDFQSQMSWVNTGLPQKEGESVYQVALTELFARNIDAHSDRRLLRIPLLKQFQLAAGFLKNPLAD